MLSDRLLYRDPSNPDHKLTGFLQAGLGDADVNRFGSYVGGGLTAIGMVKGRENDQLGLGIACARNGSHYMRSQQEQGQRVTHAETTIELTYLYQVSPRLAIQPDL